MFPATAPREGFAAKRPHALLSKRSILLTAAACTICVLVTLLITSWTEESVDVAAVSSSVNGSLLNQTSAESFGRRALLRNLLLSVSRLAEEQAEWRGREERERGEQYTDLQRRLVDLRAAAGDSASSVVKQVRELQEKGLSEHRAAIERLQRAVEDQGAALREQQAELKRLKSAIAANEAMTEYRRAEQAEEYMPRTVTRDRPHQWQQRTFRSFGAYGFIYFSAYRISRYRIAVLGLAARNLQAYRQLSWCEWEGLDGSSTRGTLSMLYAKEHHDLMYETVVLNCDLPEELKQSGGTLRAKIDQEIMFLYRESAAQPLDEPQQDFDYELAYCGPPMYGKMNARVVSEWMDYHHVYMGADHFVLYDAGGVDTEMLGAIERYVRGGFVTITNFRDSNMWEVWLWAQSLAIHDCTYRLRSAAKWVFMHDFDEFFEVSPPQTVKQVLERHEGRPWLTFGAYVFSIRHCVPPDTQPLGKFLLSRMQFRWPHVYCQKEEERDRDHCLDQWGHRKYILNPRKVFLLQIHIVLESDGEGVDLSVTEARHDHFQGLANAASTLCNSTTPTSWWLQYEGVDRVVRAVESCTRNDATKLCDAGAVATVEAAQNIRVEDYVKDHAVKEGQGEGE